METMWVVAIVAAVVAAGAGFFIGRSTGGSKERIAELETEVSRRNEEIAEYKKEVETHFDKTATLFVDMAGSYKALFEHLSADYEKLSEGSARELFKERVSAMLLENGGSAERKAIAGNTGQVGGEAKPAEAAAASDVRKDDTRPAESEKPQDQTADAKADEQAALASEAEKKQGADEASNATTPEAASGEPAADKKQGDAPAEAAEKAVKPEAEREEKTTEADAAKPQAEDKPVGDGSQSTLERAAKKRAESAATEGGSEGKGS